MEKVLGYQCSLCGKQYGLNEVTYVCPADGGNLNVVYDYEGIRKNVSIKDITSNPEPSLWRYLPILPVNDPGGYGTPLRLAGWTPVSQPPLLAKNLGLKQLWIKDEGRNPSASFKDRASSVVVARTREIKAEVVVTASTGNAGAALACMSAAVGQRAVIFAPKTAPQAKIAQLLVFGAQVILVDDNYDAAFDLTIEAANEFGWYCRNTGYNPFTAEGKKTGGLEIWEQVILPMGKTNKPLNVFVSVGDGNIISGIHKGLKDLQALGWLEQMPRLFGIQSDKSAAIANAFKAGTEEIIPVQATTIADSISVDLPRDGVRAVRAARETGGAYITVPDEDIIAAIGEVGKSGIFVEPAGATAYAGLQKAVREGIITPDDPVLVINTGSGLKDVRAAMMAVQAAPVIEANMKALKKLLAA
ncbi:MAG: threonine synthase [Anaerolineaceae bacterium]